ncbi:uncharacterized protein LOC110464894 [Mizuhopecten yessoensis]|uniref:uncharacterized protein LOC110464894 n=1 Tax=Mizuhopecten yessoensis TaxID=6573 RepID=UPI000B45CD84|nr:uncharacterized protein LOC110464894 [Mizuhopecten yessoensis]
MIDGINYLPGLGKSDHIVLTFEFTCYSKPKANKTNKLCYHKGNYDNIREDLGEMDITELKSMNAVVETWNYLAEKLFTTMEKNIPVSKIGPGMITKKPYIDNNSLEAIQNKHRAWTKYLHCKTAENYEEVKNARHRTAKALKKSMKNYEKGLADNIIANPKAFWKYVNSKTKTQSTINKVTKTDGTLTTNDKETAETLNNYFASVFVIDGNTNIPNLTPRTYEEVLDNIIISPELVKKAIKRLNRNKSAGPDNIHPRVLVNTIDEIAEPLM